MRHLSYLTKAAGAAVFCLWLVGGAPAAEEVKLIYPTDAAAAELDNSRPEKRIEPPVREESEIDVVTPLGQVKSVLDSLETIEASQAALARDLANLRTLDLSNAFPLIEKTAEGQKEVLSKIDQIQKTTENLRASIEAAEKTTANVKAIQENKLTIFLLVAILVLLLCQIAWKFGAGIWKKLAERRRAYIVAEAERLQRQYAQAAAGAPAAPAGDAK